MGLGALAEQRNTNLTEAVTRTRARVLGVCAQKLCTRRNESYGIWNARIRSSAPSLPFPFQAKPIRDETVTTACLPFSACPGSWFVVHESVIISSHHHRREL